MSMPNPTYGHAKKAVGDRLHLCPSSLNIFGIFLGSLTTPGSLCDDNDYIPEGVSNVSLRRLSFDSQMEKVILNEDVSALTLIYWEVLHEFEEGRILPCFSPVEIKVLKSCLQKGWIMPGCGEWVWPSVESMREFLCYVRTKRSAYYWLHYYKLDSCLVRYSEPVFAGVLPGIRCGEGKLLNVAVAKTGIIFLDNLGEKLCLIPWCAVSSLKMDTGTNYFTIDLPAIDDYNIIHSVNVPVEANGVDYLYSVAQRVLKIHHKIFTLLCLRRPHTLLPDEYDLLRWIKPPGVPLDHFMTWVLPHCFQRFPQLSSDKFKYQWVRHDKRPLCQKSCAKRKALHAKQKANDKIKMPLKLSLKVVLNDKFGASLLLPQSSLTSSLEDCHHRKFVITYFSHLTCLNSLLKNYSLMESAKLITRSASYVKLLGEAGQRDVASSSVSSHNKSAMSLTGGSSLIEWGNSEGQDAVVSPPPPAVVKSARNVCYRGVVLFQINYATALKYEEEKENNISDARRIVTGVEGLGESISDSGKADLVAESLEENGGSPKISGKAEESNTSAPSCSSVSARNKDSCAPSGEIRDFSNYESSSRSQVKEETKGEVLNEHLISTATAGKSAKGEDGNNFLRVRKTYTSTASVVKKRTSAISAESAFTRCEVQTLPTDKDGSRTGNEDASILADELAFKGGSEASLAASPIRHHRVKRIVIVNAFGNRSFSIPILDDHCQVGRLKKLVACKCLHLKESSCCIFGIFLPPLGSPGAFLSDKSTLPSCVHRVCFQRVSFVKEQEHEIIRHDKKAVNLLYSEGVYSYRQGLVLPKPSAREQAYLDTLIERKRKLTFVKRISGFNVGTKRFPKFSTVADYWWNYFYRAEFCCLYENFPLKTSTVSKGSVVHVVLLLDQLLLLSMEDAVLSSWPMRMVRGVFIQNTENDRFVVFEILRSKEEGARCDDFAVYLHLETHFNEYLFSLCEHIFRIHTSRDGAEQGCISENIAVNHGYDPELPGSLMIGEDPVFRVVNASALTPTEGDEDVEHCDSLELIDVYSSLKSATERKSSSPEATPE